MEDIIEQEATEEQLAQQPIEQPDQPQETVPAQEPEEAPPAPQPRTYTQDEVDAIVSKRLSRKETSIRKEYDRQYGGLMDVLRAGTGKDSVDEIADSYRQFYQGQGVSVPQRSAFTDDDIRVLAQAEAQEIISGGDSEVAEEVDRLAGIGSGKMTAREKELFRVLAEHRHAAEQSREPGADRRHKGRL